VADPSVMSYNVTPSGPRPPATSTGLVIAGISGAVVVLLVAVGLAVNVAKHVHDVLPSAHAVATLPRTPSSTSSRNAAALRHYEAPLGTHGLPLTAGQPWGRTCQPVRITVEEHVPGSVYAQIVAVVNQARHDGIDITMENRSFLWRPKSLYYPVGVSPADVVRVGVFASNATSLMMSNGQPQRLRLGWDTALQPGGQNENLVDAQGSLQLAALSGPAAQRTAVRQIIALTQGIVATNSRRSGITTGTTRDAFSRADISAMKAMSGCGRAVQSTVAHTATGA
jgi:hypothetical protein